MNIIYLLIPLALILGVFFVVSFIWATSKGQFDDLDTPATRILFDDDNTNIKTEENLGDLLNEKGKKHE
ncbi:cbb3-type cytochrome oxidase assembly protein CcoS [Halobacteriovorax sp. HLS]|uniref:cbb3-type cytochrome oxidase assembly protein CcoS n=1 Tax=Halobacteriovorax sp. HLS TaxID=2234000 RepID=UPI000FD9D747|nr:cbb3-type cytochrome oxidase assembly protein CcoS [Halobacteriovorax sp. HLS]